MTGRARFGLYLLLAAALVGGYALAARQLYRPGFPLDDAWIHQAYARSLAERGEWSFLPGQPSAGSTAPLWSALLAVGYGLGIPPLVWSHALGALTLAALGHIAADTFMRLQPGKSRWAVWAGLLVAAEWHLVWAAGSGMETLLFALIAFRLLHDLLSPQVSAFRLGLLAGLAVWLRPDGLTLLGPAAFTLVLRAQTRRQILDGLARLAAGTGALVLPYLAFNLALSGEIWPTTLFAKQAEYAALRMLPFSGRLVDQMSVPLVGVGAVLLPGVLWAAVDAWKGRRWGSAAALLWMFGLMVTYAWRLPVIYQHGRYLIPAIPVWAVWGFAGLAAAARPRSRAYWTRVGSRAWAMLALVVPVVFLILGGRAYARDVAVIESEMVDAARWVAANTRPDDLIAAHDIGALGYFSGRPLLDMAGLVSPEVIPILRDEEALADLLAARGAEYLVTLEGWYPTLERGLQPVYRTGAPFSPAQGGTNMVVYPLLPH